MANVNGDVIFSKKLSKTDVTERFHWPARYLDLLPFDGNARQVDFYVKGLDGRMWNFRCLKRDTGYDKSVISSGWIPFASSKRDLKAGDEVIFRRNNDFDGALFVVSIKRKVPLFGVNLNEVEE